MSARNPIDEQRRHERLCEYLFGELEGAERAAFEIELAASPELQEERARLLATIDLVRDALPAEEALSPAARAALTAAAAGKGGEPRLAPIHPWPQRIVRSPMAAAAAVLVGLGLVATLALRERPLAPSQLSEELAQADSAEKARELTDGDAPAAEAAPAQEAGRTDRSDTSAPPAGGEKLAFDGEAAAKEVTADVRAQQPSPAELEQEIAVFLGRDQAVDSTAAAGALPTQPWGEAKFKDGILSEGDASLPPVLDAQQLEDLAGLAYLGGGGGSAQPKEEAPPVDIQYVTRGPEGETHGGLSAGQDPGAFNPDPQAASNLSGGTNEGTPIGVGSSRHFGTGTPSSLASRQAGAGPATQGLAPAQNTATGSDAWFLGVDKKGDGATAPAAEPSLDDRVVESEGARRLKVIDLNGFGASSVAPQYKAPPYDVDARCDELVRFCRIRPNETPSAMFFRCWGDNPFEFAQLDPLSTFAADVDTASYALARNYLSQGYMPTKEQIRTEEFVNAFDSGVAAPVEDTFALDLELAPSLFGRNGEWMLRVVLRGKDVEKSERPHLALTFVIDVSGSMEQGNRLELVKHALRLLIAELDARDSLAIVAFSTEARLVLPMTSAGNRGVIESALFGLRPDGSTNAEAGLNMGYEVAGAALTAGANNRVVLLSDGVANVGNTGVDAMLAGVAEQRQKGIYLNTIGVGMGNHNDALLEQLADKGDGICNYVDGPEEAKRALVDNFTAAFVPLARDVKLQVEFAPAEVQSYRLLGYENRAVADAQFREDKVDAGELGAGHQVTALYELVRSPTATGDGPLATARVRYKPPFAVDAGEVGVEARAAAETAREIERKIAFQQVLTDPRAASVGYQKAVLVAQFAELLRRSVHARGDGYDSLVTEVLRVEQVAEDPDFTAFARLVAQHRDLIKRHLPADDAVAQALDELTRKNYLEGQLERLKQENHALTTELLEKLQRENAELEQRIKDLLKEQLEKAGK